MSLPWTTIARWDTGYSADSVEWCPVEGFRDVLACATYQLFKEEEGQPSDPLAKQQRLGRIYLFPKIGHDTTELNPIQTIDTSGILDQKWCHHEINGFPILAVVTSDGKLQLYKLLKKEHFEFEFWLETSIGQNILALSLDWSSNRSKTEPKIVVSDSAGSVTVFKVDNGLEAIGTWISHGFEAWIAAFDYWNTDVFYSGGDDCAFKSYDLRVPEEATSTNRKSHDAGVTTIKSHVEVEHQLLTGSYDERVRVWDARSLKTCVSERDVSGGVWRLKWHPYKHDTILAACMYGGFRILELSDEMKVVAEYLEHESIAYGADWKFDENNLIATCSFYDCKMHISGDDCAFKSYDLRVPEEATSTNRKSHDAGVTTIKSHVEVEHQLLTGSYDERVRVWDARSLKTCVSERDVSGGVWRLKWHPYKHDTILAACMYGGFRILELSDEMKVVAEYLEHESIAYGADWKFDENNLIATCSFYDCKMHISQFNSSNS